MNQCNKINKLDKNVINLKLLGENNAYIYKKYFYLMEVFWKSRKKYYEYSS